MKRTNKRRLGSKRHMSGAKKMSRSRKGGFGDEDNEVGDPKFDRDMEESSADVDADADLMETEGDEMVGGKRKKGRRHSKKRKAHKTHKRRHGRKHSKSHKKK
jgi:hypothetical protein